VEARQGSGTLALGFLTVIPAEMLFAGLVRLDSESLSASEICDQIDQAGGMKREITENLKDGGERRMQNEAQWVADPGLEEVFVNLKRAHGRDAVFEVELGDHCVVYGPRQYYWIRLRQWKRSVCGSGSNRDRLYLVMKAIELNLCGYVIEAQEHLMKEQSGGVLCLTMLMAVGLSLDSTWVVYVRAKPVDFVLIAAAAVSTGPGRALRS
jgi:hypothetical protein